VSFREEIIGPCRLILGDCREVLPTLGKVDAVVTDPPYAEIDRDYGRLTEAEWHSLMDAVVPECRRVVSPDGSAVFILQPNSERVGRMRPWLFEFIAKWARDWNLVQDVWWWNFTSPPTVHAHEANGLMKPSVKACVWLGGEDCFRDQNAVLWKPSDAILATKLNDRALERHPSGLTMRKGRVLEKVLERGGSAPFNLIPIANANSVTSGGADGHGAATPQPLCDWWVGYLSKEGQTVCDPFMGSGTVGVSSVNLGREFVGIEQDISHFDRACRRIEAATKQPDLFIEQPKPAKQLDLLGAVE
jgi:site-specific DNA-methyltransferase (adenine-specific)